jgi:hypothetical protein
MKNEYRSIIYTIYSINYHYGNIFLVLGWGYKCMHFAQITYAVSIIFHNGLSICCINNLYFIL